MIRQPLPVSLPNGTTAAAQYLRGPVPWAWLNTAAALPAKALHVGIALWFEAGRQRTRRVRLTNRLLARMKVSRWAKYRALDALERADLVQVDREANGNLVVLLLQPGIDERSRSAEPERSDESQSPPAEGRGDVVSVHEIRVFRSLEGAGWVTAGDVSKSARVSPRTARSHLLKFVQLGLVEVARVFPAFRYRIAANVDEHQYAVRLRKASTLFSELEEQEEAE